MSERVDRLNVNLRGPVADKFKRIKAYLDLENDTEVIRSLISWYYSQHEKELTGPPKLMWKINLDDNGAWIWDPDLQNSVEVYFKPEGIKCGQCLTNDCKHVQWALSRSDIQEVIRKRRKEGWKLPKV